jgi:hypothetical protein
MRVQTTITDLSEDQWAFAQEVLRTQYEIPAGSSRACLTLEHAGEERHVELPLAALIGFQSALGLHASLRAFRTAMAALTPDALSEHLEEQRNAADPQRAAERAAGACPDGREGCLVDHSQTTRPL